MTSRSASDAPFSGPETPSCVAPRCTGNVTLATFTNEARGCQRPLGAAELRPRIRAAAILTLPRACFAAQAPGASGLVSKSPINGGRGLLADDMDSVS